MKKNLRLILGILISLLFLYLAMRGTDWPELWQLFRGANYWYLLPALIVIILVNWVRAYRWRLLMYPDHHLPLERIFWIVNIGYFFNNVFPAKLGELVRAYLVGREIKGGIGQALSTLLIERLLDVLAAVAILVLLLPFVSLPEWVTRGGLLFGALAIGGAIVLLILSRFGRRGVDWLWRWVGRVPLLGHPKMRSALQNLVDGFGVLTVGRVLPGILLGSVLVWFGYFSLNYLIMMTFRLNDLPLSAAALVLCTTAISMVVPSSPGAMGVFEWAGVQALAVYGVAQGRGFGYMLGLHVFTNVVLILLGLIGLFREGLSYRSLRSGAIKDVAGTSLDGPEEKR